MFDPVLQMPLIISAPGQTSRRDINIPTSSIDLLPTLAHLAGGAVPAWCEGQVLAGLGGPQDPERSIYMMDAARNSAFRPLLNRAAFALRKGAYKLICYRGFREYGRKDTFELYDMLNDPDELNNRYSDGDPLSAELRAELLARLDSENEKF
jgi:arylsulfatase A-like enzyme